MTDLESLKDNLLTEFTDDHVGLWSVIRDVAETLAGASEVAVRERTFEVLHDLLATHRIEAGFPTADGRGFDPWRVSPEEVLERIRQEWPVGRRPTIGESLWFTRAD